MNFFISKHSLIQLSCPKLNVKFGARTAYSMAAATGKIWSELCKAKWSLYCHNVMSPTATLWI